MKKGSVNYLYLLIITAFVLMVSLVACSGPTAENTTSGGSTNAENNEAEGSSNSGNSESSGSDEEVEIRVVTAFPEHDVLSQGYVLFKEYMENNAENIKITYIGGPEAIPPFELGEAVRNQVVDIIVTPAAYYSDALPEGLLLSYSELDTEQEIANGAIDYLDQLHQEKLNAKLLGRGSEVKFNFYTLEEINSMEDFEGLNLRGTPTYGPFIEALGAEMISMPGGEIYTSLQRGVIDGYGWGHLGIISEGLHEVTNYVIKPDFYHMDVVLAMNLDKWNELDAGTQQIVMDAIEEMQSRLPDVEAEFAAEEQTIFEEKGIEVIELGDEYRDLAYESAWNWMEQHFPDEFEKMNNLFR